MVRVVHGTELKEGVYSCSPGPCRQDAAFHLGSVRITPHDDGLSIYRLSGSPVLV